MSTIIRGCFSLVPDGKCVAVSQPQSRLRCKVVPTPVGEGAVAGRKPESMHFILIRGIAMTVTQPTDVIIPEEFTVYEVHFFATRREEWVRVVAHQIKLVHSLLSLYD